MKSDMFPEQAEFFLWHSIHVKDKFYLNFSSKKVGYQKLILSVFISKTWNYNEFTNKNWKINFWYPTFLKKNWDRICLWHVLWSATKKISLFWEHVTFHHLCLLQGIYVKYLLLPIHFEKYQEIQIYKVHTSKIWTCSWSLLFKKVH